MHKGDGDRGDLSKIVITRNRSGRIIRCKDDDDSMDSVGDSRRRDENWKRGHDDEGSKRSHDADIEYRNTRRVFTPPRNAREGEYGSLTAHQNDNDLPMNYRSLQERVQARLRAIERRHLQDEGIEPPPVPEAVGGGGGMMKGGREGSYPNPLDDRGESPRGGGGNFQGHWRGGGGPMHFERRGGGGFNRPDYYNRGGGPGGYYGRGRGMRGGPRWRGQWDDFRGRRGNWHPRFEDRERRRDVGGGMSGGFDRRRRRRVSDDRSSRSRSRSDRSRSRSRSYSRSASSASQSPVRPGAKGRVISRARIKTPPLAPLTNVKRSASDENLAELDNFVAQLRAKRQMEQEMQQQQQYLNQMQGEQSLPPAYPGPQVIPPVSASSVTADVERGEYDDQWDSQQPRIIGPVKPMRNVQQINSTADEEDEDIAEPASPPMRDREMDDEAAIPEAASPDSANASSPAMEQSVEA